MSLHFVEVLALLSLAVFVVAVAVGTFLDDNSECDELPMQRRRVTPEPPLVRKVTFFDQDAHA